MATQPKSYHHGDLRAALLAASEDELTEKGMEKFSLRSVAKRAGVSHAAPAHHFGDVKGLLTALAASGYDRFLATQKARQRAADPDPREQLIQSGLGYIDFALAHPALFRLMFGSRWPEGTDPAFKDSADAGFEHLLNNVSAITGGDPEGDLATQVMVVAAWSTVHGLADLLIGGSPHYLAEAAPEAREAMMREIIGRSLG